MARARKKALPAPTTDTAPETATPDVFDQAIAARQQAEAIVHQVAESTRLPDAEREAAHEHGHQHGHNGHAARHAHIANPSGHRRPLRKLPGTLSITAGDLKVRLIDKGDNLAGIGIQVVTPEGRKLTDEEKQLVRKHVKGTEQEPSGYQWMGDLEMWHKHIARGDERREDIPPARAVAIRLDAERRVEGLAEDLRRLHGQETGFTGAETQRRESGQENGHSAA